MKIIDVVQGTEEWLEARRGIPTASNFDKIVTSKGEPSKQRTKYLYKLAGERISGTREESYTNVHMERGKEMESEARKLYEFHTGLEVEQVGFCLTDDGKVGASPDGICVSGLLEIKSPSMAVHVGYLLDGKVPTDYFQQVQGGLYVAEKEWCDFVSYYPGINSLIVRMKRDKVFIEKLAVELEIFNEELENIVKKIEDYK
jgi:putative phage-type endonuclease